MLPLRIAMDLLQPSPPIESSLHLMLIPFVQIRHRSMDLACHPGLGPLLKTVRVQGTTTAVTFVTVAVRKNAIWNYSFLATRLATVEGPVHGEPLLLKDWNFYGSHLRNTRCDSHQGGHLRNTRCDSHQEGHPLQENGIRTKGVTLSKANGIRFYPLHSEWDSLQGSPLLNSRCNSHHEGHPLQSEWDSLLTPGLVAARDSSPRPRYSRDSLSPKGFASVPKRMGFASRDSPSPKRQRFESRDSDSPRRRHSFRASSREASVERHQSRSSPTHPYSPSRQDKEAEDTSMPAPVKAMMDFGFFLRNNVPDFRYLPICIKEGIADERSLRSCLESYNFLT